jgi:hypothetical protein
VADLYAHWTWAQLRTEVGRLTAALAEAQRELDRWRKSFDGHVYVTNEAWAAVCQAKRDAEARLATLEAAVALRDTCVVCGSSLWPIDAPPHCEDCHPSEDATMDFNEALLSVRAALDTGGEE